jgi:fructose-bisphosphate aldolase class II
MTAHDYFQKTFTEHFAIGAFNTSNLEITKAIINTAKKLSSPVIIEASPGEIDFIGHKNLVSLIKNSREEHNLPIFTNLDHSPTPESIQIGLTAGFDLVHFDGNQLPLEENLKKTKKIVEIAHNQNVMVEAEIDTITGGSSLHQTLIDKDSLHLTNPDTAQNFVSQTNIDTLAISIGNLHGLYQNQKNLNLDLLQQIRQKLPCFISLHGGSGIPNDQIKKAIEIGITKINVNTELRVAYREALETSLRTNQEIAPYKFMSEVITAIEKVVEEKIILFGSQNKA